MNDKEFYVQLMSNASTDEFPSNKANSFKNRLPYPLVFDGSWKVGLAGITYPTPPARPHQAHPFASDELICRFEYTEIGIMKRANDNRNVIVRFRNTLEIKGADLNRDQAKVTGGKSFMKYIFHRIMSLMSTKMESKNESLRSDSDGKNMYPILRVKGNDFIIDNTDTFLNESGDRKRPVLIFGSKFARDMEWIGQDAYGNYVLKDNLIKEFNGDTIPGSFPEEWSTHEAGELGKKQWSYFWRMTKDGLQLGNNCNWRFTYLDEAYQKAYGGSVTTSTPHRAPLYIYSNVGRSTITGNRVTDLLREVPHDPTKMTYEPPRVQYKSIRSNIMDIIETEVSEEDGTLVNFISGVTTVTLHFKESGSSPNTIPE